MTNRSFTRIWSMLQFIPCKPSNPSQRLPCCLISGELCHWWMSKYDKILPNKESLHRRHCRYENHWSCFLWLKNWDLGIFHIRKLFRSYSVKFAFEKKKKKRTIYLNKGMCNSIPQESFIISPLNINLLNVFQKGTFNHK